MPCHIFPSACVADMQAPFMVAGRVHVHGCNGQHSRVFSLVASFETALVRLEDEAICVCAQIVFGVKC